MSDEAAQARRQQRLEALCGAAVRALSGEPGLQFRGGRLQRGRQTLPLWAPHLHPDLARDNDASFRGAADGLALRLRGCDAALHQRLAPATPLSRLLFDLLEQFRVEALAPAHWPGVPLNLRQRFHDWSLSFQGAGLADTARGILLYTVAQMARARVLSEPVPEQAEDLIEATRAALAPALGPALAGLRRHRHDQQAYAQHALALALQVDALLQASGEPDDAADAGADAAEAAARAAFGLPLDEPALGDSGATAGAAASGQPALASADYRVYSTAYDRELDAARLARPERLREARALLDRRVAALGLHPGRLARDLRKLFALPREGDWQCALEEGRLDGRALARLVASPAERHLFRDRPPWPQPEVALTVLVDASGSMRDHVAKLAPLLDLLLRALEQAGLQGELLGFGTGAWQGGRAGRDWQRAGRPAMPGRLNERLHVVFKAAAQSWRRARPGIAALLQPEWFREGLDGEAVEWALQRLQASGAPRQCLLVLSDGCPMDGATAAANGAGYLQAHLHQVLQRHERAAAVQIAGLGVGVSLSGLYDRHHALDLQAPPMALLRGMLAPLHRR